MMSSPVWCRGFFGVSAVGLLLVLPGEPTAPLRQGSRSAQPVERSVIQLAEHEWRLSRAGMIQRMTQDFVSIISLAETDMTPLYAGEQLLGYRVGKRMARCAFYRDLGLRGGDIIRSVNGQPLQSLYEMYLRFRWIDEADVLIERGGRHLTLRYWIS